MTTWLIALLFVGVLVLAAALYDEWREHADFTSDGLADDPAHADTCHICAQRRTK